MKRFLVIAIVAFLALAGSACKTTDDETKRKTLPKPVHTGIVGQGTIERHLTAPGSVVPVRDVWVSAEVGGRVVAKYVTEGQRVYVEPGVPAGEQTTNRIAAIDPADYQRRLSQAEASLEVAKAGLSQYTATQKRLTDEVERKRPLHEQKIISDNAWNDLVTRKEEADALVALYTARVEEARQTVEIARSDLAKTTVRSPLDDALVAEAAFDGGEFVTVGQRLARVVDLDEMWVDVEVGESRLAEIRLGSVATFSVPAYPDAAFSGAIETISPAGDPQSRSFLVRLAVDNADHRLKAGMFAVVQIAVNERHGVTVIPRSAVKQEGKFRYVFLVEGDTAIKHSVQLGYSTGDLIEVLGETLTPGQTIVIAGVEDLNDGDLIKAVEAKAPAAE